MRIGEEWTAAQAALRAAQLRFDELDGASWNPRGDELLMQGVLALDATWRQVEPVNWFEGPLSPSSGIAVAR